MECVYRLCDFLFAHNEKDETAIPFTADISAAASGDHPTAYKRIRRTFVESPFPYRA